MAETEVLVALLRSMKDFAILQTEGWYRIPVEHTPRRGEYCLPRIQDTINILGGLVDDGLVPRKFFDKGGDAGQQLSLFEQSGDYLIDEGEPFDLD